MPQYIRKTDYPQRSERGVSWFHDFMFHGGELLPFRRQDPRVLPRPPLRLWRNVYRDVDVFVPEGPCAIIVSRQVLDELSGIVTIPHVPAVVGLSFTLPWCETEVPAAASKWPGEYDELVNHYLPTVGTTSQVMGDYYELVPGRADARSAELKGAVLQDFRWGCSAMEYAVSDRVASVLRNYIDDRYVYLGPDSDEAID